MIDEKLEKCCIIDETLHYGKMENLGLYNKCRRTNNEKLKNHIHPLCNL